MDARLAQIAARQHGVVSRAQLLSAGLPATAIDYRVRVGRLQLVHRGVYGVGHCPTSRPARAMAAVLACGSGAVLSHRSAAALWEIDPRWREPLEVTSTHHPRPRGIRVHRTRSLTATHVTSRLGIPVTTPARTLLDLTHVLDDRALTRAANQAQVLRLVRLDHFAALLASGPGRATARLRRLVETDDAPTRSVFEDAFLAFVERHGLPRPRVNRRVVGHEVDMLWPAERLIVELDGYAYHGHRRSFEHDRERDADLLAAGYRVVRVTWRRLRDRPVPEAARLQSLLARVGRPRP